MFADLDLRYKSIKYRMDLSAKKEDVSSGLYIFEINNLEPGGVEYDFEVILAAVKMKEHIHLLLFQIVIQLSQTH